MKNNSSRRSFLRQSSLAGLGTVLSVGAAGRVFSVTKTAMMAPAILGGRSAWDHSKWIKWPVWNPETDEKRVLEVLRSGVWSRSTVVSEFETEWSKILGVKRSLAVVNGTNALIVALNQLHIHAGDEVIVPPYTFIATIQAILANSAMPVFVDIDPETFQIDPSKIQEKITSRTKAILPVHILGLPADMDRIMAIAKKHKLIVLEDACQAPLAEINHKKVGTIGDAGCFSFQNSKNIAIGEGGAIVSNSDEFMDRCFSFQNLGYPYGSTIGAVSNSSVMQGTKVRFTEYQAAIGLAQLQRLDEQTTKRNINAAYLKKNMSEIPGILPYKLYDNVTRAAFHLFAFRYKKELFKGLSRDKFLKALQAEGIPAQGGYIPLNTQPYLEQTFRSVAYKKAYSAEMLDFNKFKERNKCGNNDQVCTEAVWIPQNVLLAEKSDMDAITFAIEKIYENAEKINNSI